MTHNKKRAPYRTILKPRTSAERGQENGQRDYRAHPAQRSNHLHSKREGRLPPSLLPKPLFFFAPGAARFFFSSREKKKWGRIPVSGKEKIPARQGKHPFS